MMVQRYDGVSAKVKVVRTFSGERCEKGVGMDY